MSLILNPHDTTIILRSGYCFNFFWDQKQAKILPPATEAVVVNVRGGMLQALRRVVPARDSSIVCSIGKVFFCFF